MLEVRALSISVPTPAGPTAAVEHVSFSLERGGSLGLVGESGSGKTLTCRAILGVLPAGCEVTHGSISLDGTDLAHLNRSEWRRIRGTRIGAVFQDPASYLNPAVTVGEQLSEVLRTRTGRSRREAHAHALELFALMRLRNPLRVYDQLPRELSGGMLQRVLTAIAVSCEPDLLVADEATTALDLTTQREVIELLQDLRAELGISILFVSHDLAAVAELCDDLAVFYAGQVVEAGPTIDVASEPKHPYTEALLRVAALGAPSGAPLDVIAGHHPPVGGDTTGCRFAPRCPYATALCTEGPVASTLVDDRTVRCIRASELALVGADIR